MPTSKELTITEEQVRSAAKSCPSAANVLKALFPEVFNIFKPSDAMVLEDKNGVLWLYRQYGDGYIYSLSPYSDEKRRNWSDDKQEKFKPFTGELHYKDGLLTHRIVKPRVR